MVFTRNDQNLADKILTTRPGKTQAEKKKNLKKDAGRRRRNSVSKEKFLNSSTTKQTDLDIKGFDDGKNSKLYEYEKNEVNERMKKLRELKAEKRKKLDSEAKKTSTNPRRYKQLKRKMEEAATTGKFMSNEEKEELKRITPRDDLTQKYIGSKKK